MPLAGMRNERVLNATTLAQASVNNTSWVPCAGQGAIMFFCLAGGTQQFTSVVAQFRNKAGTATAIDATAHLATITGITALAGADLSATGGKVGALLAANYATGHRFAFDECRLVFTRDGAGGDLASLVVYATAERV